MDRPSQRMNQPQWLRGHKHRRECVTVDGDAAWQLFCAAADGALERASRLVNADPALIYAQLTYTWPIDLALREGHLDIVKIFHAADSARRLPFAVGSHYTRVSEDELARRGHHHILRYLREEYWPKLLPHTHPDFARYEELLDSQGAEELLDRLRSDPDLAKATDLRGRTWVARALERKDYELAQSLVAAGAPFEGQAVDGATAVDIAANECPDALPWLLDELDAEPSIHALAVLNRLEGMRRLIEADPGLVNRLCYAGDGPLAFAVSRGHHDAVSLLLELGANPNLSEDNAPHGSALARACLRQDPVLAKVLLEAGAKPDAVIDSSGDTFAFCLHPTQGKGRPIELHTLLLEYGGVPEDPGDIAYLEQKVPVRFRRYHPDPEPAKDGEPDLPADHVASHPVGPQELIALGRVNHRDWLGRTSLHVHAAYGDLEAVRLLCEQGANLDPIDVHSSTSPLGYAARCGQIEVVEYLLSRGANRRPVEDRPWSWPRALAEDQLLHFDKRNGPTSGHWLVHGFKTDRSREELERVIELLENK